MTASKVLPLELVSANGHDLDAVATQRNFDAISQGWPSTPGVPVTSLSGITGYDGQEVYVLADSTNGVLWRFRYRAASASAYKWEFVGGPPLSAAVATQESTASVAYVDLATVGPQIVLPLAGDFDVSVEARTFNNTGATQNYVSAGNPTGTDPTAAILGTPAVNTNTPTQRRLRMTGLASGSTVKIQYRTTGGTATYGDRMLYVCPVRVG